MQFRRFGFICRNCSERTFNIFLWYILEYGSVVQLLRILISLAEWRN